MTRRFYLALLCAGTLLGAVPTPESHFGHPIGQDRSSLAWKDVVAYFQKLAQSSDRIRVETLGPTTEGRPFIAATISSAENLKRLDRYRDIQARLADPRRTTEGEAEKLIAEGKTVVLVTCSIHSTEVASTHTAVEFAYKLLTQDKPQNQAKLRAILDNTIFLLVPSLNPDGVDIVTDWYRQTLGTPYEGTTPPRLYQKYVGHDNNRDWYIFSQQETRLAIAKLHNVWHPQIVYDVHQQGAFASRIFVPPWLDPIDPNVDPILVQLCNAIGTGMAADLTAAGRKGVAVNAMYDFWTPARHYQAYHGGLRILSESASARLSSPITVTAEQIQTNALGYNARERSWNYLEPWLGGTWRLRDIIDDQLIAMESLLYQAALRREDLLRSFYKVGQRQAARSAPYAFVIPPDQADPGATEKLISTLRFGQVEVETAANAFAADGRTYPANSLVIRMQQPYGGFAKTLLERQNYPDLRMYPGGPPRRPYDVTAQTLPLLMGVKVDTIKDRFTASLAKLTADPQRSSPPALSASDTATWKAVAQAWKNNRPIYRDEKGAFYDSEAAGRTAVAKPRIGLYRSHMPAMDEGWTRWLFDEFSLPYRSVKNEPIRQGRLHEQFDVIVFPDQSPASIQDGYREGAMPREYVGGLGKEGAAALKQFAEDGGTLVFLNESCDYATEQLGLKLKNVTKGVPNKDLYVPGSLLHVSLDTTSPLTRGLPGEIAIWAEHSPAWDVEGTPAKAIAAYPAQGLLASGWLLGEKVLAKKAALVEMPAGRGRVILFGMRPQYRAQSYLTFKLLFNALVK